MTDNKPTDNEIIKAYELCFAERGTSNTCAICPYHQFGKLCKVNRDKDALDLIIRLQAENERLSTLAELGNMRADDYRVMRDRALKAEAENERLKGIKTTDWLVKGISSEQLEKEKIEALIDNAKKCAKSEAYKEFAELLHCQCESIINQPHNENVRPISWKVAYEEFDEKVDNILKELVGESDG